MALCILSSTLLPYILLLFFSLPTPPTVLNQSLHFQQIQLVNSKHTLGFLEDGVMTPSPRDPLICARGLISAGTFCFRLLSKCRACLNVEMQNFSRKWNRSSCHVQVCSSLLHSVQYDCVTPIWDGTMTTVRRMLLEKQVSFSSIFLRGSSLFLEVQDP